MSSLWIIIIIIIIIIVIIIILRLQVEDIGYKIHYQWQNNLQSWENRVRRQLLALINLPSWETTASTSVVCDSSFSEDGAASIGDWTGSEVSEETAEV